ncbi:hypothetical protein C8R43DRAFT_171032 [Mycena crocata]|nr:hypothetical protein C8R43DRAFT_171032 [Mycena crocata]
MYSFENAVQLAGASCDSHYINLLFVSSRFFPVQNSPRKPIRCIIPRRRPSRVSSDRNIKRIVDCRTLTKKALVLGRYDRIRLTMYLLPAFPGGFRRLQDRCVGATRASVHSRFIPRHVAGSDSCYKSCSFARHAPPSSTDLERPRSSDASDATAELTSGKSLATVYTSQVAMRILPTAFWRLQAARPDRTTGTPQVLSESTYRA